MKSLLVSFVALAAMTQSAMALEQCQRSHQLKVNTQSEFDFNGKNVIRHKFDAVLSSKPFPAAKTAVENAMWWGLQLTNVVQTANGEVMPQDNDYALPFAVLRDKNGFLVDFHFPADISEDAKDKLKGLAFYLQFPANVSQIPADGMRVEIDSIGQFQAKYAETDASGIQEVPENAQFIVKQKQQYLDNNAMRLSGANSNPIDTTKVKDAEQLVTLDNCWFDSTRGRENLYFSGASANFSMSTAQTFSLIKLPNTADSLLWQLPGQLADWQLQESEAPALTEEQKEELAQRLLLDLQSIDMLSLRGSELAAFLLQYDDVIDILAPALISGDFTDEQNMRLFNALGQLDSPRGNKMLVELISNAELDETNRFRAMRAIANGTSALTPELAIQLNELLNNAEFPGSEALHGAALMTLGAVIQRREYNELSANLLTDISNKLSPDMGENAQAALVASLGNSGRPEVVEKLQDYSQNSSARIRSNAATSLGQVGTEEAQNTLKSMLHGESEDKTQQAILGAIGQFELDAEDLQKISAIAAQSPSERTRSNAIKALANQTHHAEQVQVQLQTLMKQEKSRRNFILAAKAIEALKKDPNSN